MASSHKTSTQVGSFKMVREASLEDLLRVTQRSGRRFAPVYFSGVETPPFWEARISHGGSQTRPYEEENGSCSCERARRARSSSDRLITRRCHSEGRLCPRNLSSC